MKGEKGMCDGETIVMNINGKDHDIDRCIAPIVQAFNDCGLQTVCSCCGHGQRPGVIMLADGREVMILPDYETGRQADRMFPKDINGEIMLERMKGKTLGGEIRKARMARNESLRQCAASLSLSPSWLSKLERAQTSPPSTTTLARISAYLNLNYNELLHLSGRVSLPIHY